LARTVTIPELPRLEHYEQYVRLAPAVHELRAEAGQFAPLFEGRKLWMINSTESGGGVAEMLPPLVHLLREVGIATEWVVLETDETDFFALTKRIHNLIHGEGNPELGEADRELFERVNRRNAHDLERWVQPGDIVTIHDPQPMPLASMLKARLDVDCLWRCHIGLDESNPQTRSAWDFLQPYADAYAHAIFSAPEYIPEYFSNRATVIFPALDPLATKNHEASVHRIVNILTSSGLVTCSKPVLGPAFERPAERLLPDGTFTPADRAEDIGLLHRPLVTQVSRWDRLKGWRPLMDGFARLKKATARDRSRDPLERRRLELARLVLGGPDPGAVADDPEGQEVLEELIGAYREYPPEIQADIAILALPMASVDENAHIVNALQRVSSIVVQNSLREGFGLTITEAMWKGVPVLSNRRAVGPRLQIRDGIDGRLIDDPRDQAEIAEALDTMLSQPEQRDAWGRSAQGRVLERFLIFSQIDSWIELLGETVRGRKS
jgi:trehalose synthase